jgi:RNA polymerase sigma factor (TIGR02999 family)
MPDLDADAYQHLKALALRIFAERGHGHATYQPTVLLHEAWMRLDRTDGAYESRAHYMAVAAKAMRQILINHARDKSAAKRGSGAVHTTLSDVTGALGDAIDLIAVNDALEALEAVDPVAAELATLRVYGGLTMAEAAAHVGRPERSAARSWRFARAFLATQLSEQPDH